MAGGADKGLSDSIWATGRPYRFRTTATRPLPVSNSGPLPTRPEPSPGVNNGSPNPAAASVPYHLDFQSALARVPTPWAELARHAKIMRRLKWKYPFLAFGYNAATDKALTDEQRAEAELMFKLDFFEYYMLIERALVHLLGVFGVKITGALGAGQRVESGHIGYRRQGWEQSEHRYHANVLDALGDCRNPLHEALGKDDALFALARAKELRNRWKNADEPDVIIAASNGYGNARPLEDYDLKRTLEMISAGFDKGFHMAEQYVAEVRSFAAASGVVHNTDMSDQPNQWKFMTEAMDWEAV